MGPGEVLWVGLMALFFDAVMLVMLVAFWLHGVFGAVVPAFGETRLA